jgi:hypothetical protein
MVAVVDLRITIYEGVLDFSRRFVGWVGISLQVLTLKTLCLF